MLSIEERKQQFVTRRNPDSKEKRTADLLFSWRYVYNIGLRTGRQLLIPPQQISPFDGVNSTFRYPLFYQQSTYFDDVAVHLAMPPPSGLYEPFTLLPRDITLLADGLSGEPCQRAWNR